MIKIIPIVASSQDNPIAGLRPLLSANSVNRNIPTIEPTKVDDPPSYLKIFLSQ